MNASLKISLKKAIKSLSHILISAVATAAISAFAAWLQDPTNIAEVIANSPKAVGALWVLIHPLVVAALDQYKHRNA